jgi:hypothetical protein
VPNTKRAYYEWKHISFLRKQQLLIDLWKGKRGLACESADRPSTFPTTPPHPALSSFRIVVCPSQEAGHIFGCHPHSLFIFSPPTMGRVPYQSQTKRKPKKHARVRVGCGWAIASWPPIACGRWLLHSFTRTHHSSLDCVRA